MHLYHHWVHDPQLADLIDSVHALHRKVDHLMADFTKLEAAVAKETTVVDSAIALIQGLAEEIRNLPADQAKIDELADSVDARAQALADAVEANTPTP